MASPGGVSGFDLKAFEYMLLEIINYENFTKFKNKMRN
jgi:hypothetical protein